ncbi:MAG: hypothetical protein O2913_13300 [Chloroflexi bacterium]|nr:hypothetical protein [Chloroflexota bacterium]
MILSVIPEEQSAGRDVSFALSGLTPWQPVRVSVSDPQGASTLWITVEDVNILDLNGVEATTYTMYPTESGVLDWERYAIQDEIGDWSVSIDLNGKVSSTGYSLSKYPLGCLETASVGVDLTVYSGSGSPIYYSDLVPTALVADLQEHLSDTALLLGQRTETEVGQLPDVYLMANRELMEQVGSATGVTLGFEDGYYKNYGARPGVYMRTDLQATVVRRLLTHEYVHLVFDGLAKDRQLPAWLTEGLSRYYEYDIALSGTRPNASKLRLFTDADEARAAAQAGSLFSLSALDKQSDWNSRTGQQQISLQYGEAYMAVRYLNETYGPLSGKDVVLEIGRGFSLPDSIKTVTGVELAVFESQFREWLKVWEDSDRAAIALYLSAVETLLLEREAISDKRVENSAISKSADQAAISRLALVRSAEVLLDSLRGLSPPEGTLAVHLEAEEYLERFVEWLTLVLSQPLIRRIQAMEFRPGILDSEPPIDGGLGCVALPL